MFFDPNEKAPELTHNPLKALVAPRPIGWISTLSSTGIANLAPYSFFNLIADAPFMVMFSTSGHKDSFNNAVATGEFVWNLVTQDLADAMNRSAKTVDAGIDEFELAGVSKAQSMTVQAPRVAEAAAALECTVDQFIPLKSNQFGRHNSMIIGTVQKAFIRDDMLTDGMFDNSRAKALARMGYMDYSVADQIFQLQRPD
ncbi:MAG: flavin reductase family protein [Alphaproteobacteria bacterium]